MPTYKIISIVEANNEDDALHAIASLKEKISVERYYTDAEIDAYREKCNENGEVACVDPEHHVWAVSDEDDNYCYCERCGCVEY
jgi:hypothetical protein